MTVNTKNFSSKLSGLIKSAKTQRENLQELISFGLAHYAEHHDPVYLTKVANAAIGVRSLPTRTITDYIKHHANVGWTTLKDGKKGFKRIGKETQVEMPNVTWYDWEGGKHNQVVEDYDALATIKSTLTKAFKKEEEGHLKEGQADKLARIKAIMEE
ncbi:MAG: hypothetical protein OQK13_00405 [Gammaproteobacteria bacterium]|nr:hypothetical protein [Gammaproteobacteria bacterium]